MTQGKRYKTHAWVVAGVRQTGFGILYDTGRLANGDFEPKGLRAKPHLVLAGETRREDGSIGLSMDKYAVFEDEEKALAFQRFVDSVIDAGTNKAVDALGAIQEVGKALAEHVVNVARDLNLSPEQFDKFERGLRSFEGLDAAIKKATSEGKATT